jgi:hypothetical protein
MTDRRPTASTINDTQLDQLHDRLDRAETFVTTVADIIADHEGDEWAAHPATTAIRRGFGTVPHAVRDTELRRQLDAAIRALGASETELARLRAATASVRAYLDGRDFAVTPDSILKLLDQPDSA